MKLSDRIGKAISCRLYKLARTRPGRPSMTSYSRREAADRFTRIWPWSWRKGWQLRSAIQEIAPFLIELAGFAIYCHIDGFSLPPGATPRKRNLRRGIA